MEQILCSLYGDQIGQTTTQELQKILSVYRNQIVCPNKTSLDEHDAMLITYADQIRQPGIHPLRTLSTFCKKNLSDVISSIHILPFFPYSSDDGFSIIDYRRVNPDFGDWSDVEDIRSDFRLMFDGVINHSSVKNVWFRAFLEEQQKYRQYYIEVPPETDLSQVVRPRALPLLTEFESASGPKTVWTTFSADQADLNFSDPDVLLEIIDILLGYVTRGAEFIRLDAIAYLWKEIGTSCIHLPQTHAIVRLFRQILDEVAPFVRLITETNVPHQDNISYFGNGKNEAQLVYNFSLPPLTYHTFFTGQAEDLSNWAANLELPSNEVTFFNFLASHDGIGLNPVRAILKEEEILSLARQAETHGGMVSYKTNADGSTSPYEININYFDALNPPDIRTPIPQQVNKFMCSQAIMLVIRGLPGIYFHSLFGSRGWPEGVVETGQNRIINRQKLALENLTYELVDTQTIRHAVFKRYREMLLARSSSAAFNPYSHQEILDYGKQIFSIRRTSQDGRCSVICLQNISERPQEIKVPASVSLFSPQKRYQKHETFVLDAYQVEWLSIES